MVASTLQVSGKDKDQPGGKGDGLHQNEADGRVGLPSSFWSTFQQLPVRLDACSCKGVVRSRILDFQVPVSLACRAEST